MGFTTDTIGLYNQINISNIEGYDNRPSFFGDTTFLFSSTRDNQTKIASFDIKENTSNWVSNPSDGSEYSLLKIPREDAISAIRLDTDGLQRLYTYDLKSDESKELLEGLKVGYDVWYSTDIIVGTVLLDDRMDLVVSNLINHTIQRNVGRSLHKIPNTDLISYISKEGGTKRVKSLNPLSGATQALISLPDMSKDLCRLPDGKLVTASDAVLLTCNPFKDQGWKQVHRFTDISFYGISRIVISPNGNYLALISQKAPVKLILKQIETFNSRYLEAFISNYADDVVVLNFPTDTIYYGKERMRENYKKFHARKPFVEVEVLSRIVIGSCVIDLELISIGEVQEHQVAIYETNGLIKRMCFIQDNKIDSKPGLFVQQQLDACNTKDLDGFLSTYSKDLEIFDYPNELRTKAIRAIGTSYGEFFEKTTDLYCEIKNGMRISNTIIDEQLITANGKKFKAVALYEVVKGKIKKIIFLR